MKYQLAIFDLDGTILDTIDDLADSLNHVLYVNNLPIHTNDQIRRMVGNGIKNLVKRAVPVNTKDSVLDKVFEEMIIYYKIHCADKTKPYEGIIALIKALRNDGYKTAVVSNKADSAVQILCETYFDGLFDYAVGERESLAKKPSPDSVNEVLAHLNISADSAVYIGDSEVDIQTAANAKMNGIIVSWGFRHRDFLKSKGAKTIVDTVDELMNELS